MKSPRPPAMKAVAAIGQRRAREMRAGDSWGSEVAVLA
jgi:hypothetical protein